MKKVRNLSSKKIISGSDYKRLVKEKFSYGFPTVSVTQPSDSTGNTKVLVGYIQCGLSMMSWSIHTLFLVNPFPFYYIKGYGLTKIKKVWVNQDVIVGPLCT